MIRKLFCSIFLATTVYFNPGYSADLYSIIICDSSDKKIGKGVEVNYKNIKKEIEKIAFYTHLNLKEKIFLGEWVKPKDVLKYLKSLSFEPDDTVVFYFSGHGYRTHRKDNPWPNLYYSLVRKGIDYDYMIKILKDKNPFFLLAVAECCNNTIDEKVAPPLMTKDVTFTQDFNTLEKNYLTLFRSTPGTLMITSSIEGQFSWINLSLGGIFTNTFLHCFLDEIQKNERSSWDSIISRTIDGVIKQTTNHPVMSPQVPFFYFSQ